MGHVHRGLSAEASTALSTSFTVMTLDDDTTDEESAEVVPDECHLGTQFGEINTIASSAKTVTWYLAADSSGDVPITPEVTETIRTGDTTSTDGGIATKVDMPHRKMESGTAGKLYLVAKTNTGTCNMIPRLSWTVEQ